MPTNMPANNSHITLMFICLNCYLNKFNYKGILKHRLSIMLPLEL